MREWEGLLDEEIFIAEKYNNFEKRFVVAVVDYVDH